MSRLDVAAGASSEGATEHGAKLELRPALAGDEAALQFFFDTLLRRDYFLRRGQLRDMLRSSHHRVLIAEIQGVLVGIAILTRGSQLVNVLVHPAYRGLGIGRALIVSSRADRVRAKLDMSTGDPRGFYKALGFVSTGRRNAKGNIELLRRARHLPGGSGAAQEAGALERTTVETLVLGAEFSAEGQ